MRQLVITLLLGLGLAACGGGEKPNVELVKDMMVSPALKAQDFDPVTGKSTMKLPPEGTLPIGHQRYPYGPAELAKAAAELKNPLAGEQSPKVLARGKNRFEIYCGVCHGMNGRGDGPVAEKMPLRPPSLVSDQVKAYSDGYFFHVMTQGKGVMGSYADQVRKPEDRWAVVNYIRSLQKLAN